MVLGLGQTFCCMLLGFTLLYFIYRKISNNMKANSKKTNDTAVGQEENESGYFYLTPEMMQLKQEQISRLKELATHDPNRVAAVLKIGWEENSMDKIKNAAIIYIRHGR